MEFLVGLISLFSTLDAIFYPFFFFFPLIGIYTFSVVVIFNLLEPGNISRALCGDQVGTLIDQAGRIS